MYQSLPLLYYNSINSPEFKEFIFSKKCYFILENGCLQNSENKNVTKHGPWPKINVRFKKLIISIILSTMGNFNLHIESLQGHNNISPLVNGNW